MSTGRTVLASRTRFSSWRIALFVLVVSSIAWLGATNVRVLIGNDILKTSAATIEFDDALDPQAEHEAFRLIAVASVVVLVGYALVLVSGIVFCVTSPFKMREHGWLMMSAILFFIFVPVELYTLRIDAEMIYREFYTTAENEVFRELMMARIKALAGVPFIGQLCYYTIIALAVFQPMKRSLSAEGDA